VLGVGRVLLHESVAAALGSHWIGTDAAAAPGSVATFAGPAGERLTLVRSDSAAEGLRQATLEEVVLGYLASGRGVTAPASAPAERAA
jgi:hypothetical protein